MDYWTDAAVARLKALVTEGLSGSQVAAALSPEFGAISRGAADALLMHAGRRARAA